MEGYTLAVDFPNRPEARDLIRRLEAMTAAADGRLYFAKDSLARGAEVRAMYPELDDWRRVVDTTDPGRQLLTDMVRRLNLRSAQ
jgi:decaprenylphospho-beta-D-ribofuranose 2-oxidase